MTADPVTRLILDEAGPLTGRVLVIDDEAAALTLAAQAYGAEVATYCDDLLQEAAVPAQCRVDSLSGASLRGVTTVLWRLPKSLGALEEYAQAIAAHADPAVRVVAGGRVKHMTTTQNAMLARSFTDVRASLGRDKCRVLHAAGPVPRPPSWPKRNHVDEFGLDVVAHGAAFSQQRLDAGTRLLLRALAAPGGPVPLNPDRAPHAIDLGCGSGILAAWLAGRGYRVTAVDVSRAACNSAHATAAANGVAVDVRRNDGLTGFPPDSVDLVVCNPPFHVGTTKDSTPAVRMIREAAPALAEGGEFWTVFNSHLPYLPVLREVIGPTRIVARDRAYTVTRSVRTGAGAAIVLG